MHLTVWMALHFVSVSTYLSDFDDGYLTACCFILRLWFQQTLLRPL